MKIRVLGSSGSEVPGHNPPAFLVDDFLLLDAGTVSISLDRESQCKITHIFLTHAHLDHIKGIPFLLDNMVMSKEGCELTILSGKDVIADLRKNIFNNRIWPDFSAIPSSERPILRYQEISMQEPFELGSYRIITTAVNHSVPAYGYILRNASAKTLVYTGDTGPTDLIWQRMIGHHVKAAIVEVSFPDEMKELALTSGHLTPSLLKEETLKMPVCPDSIYISHMKPFYRKSIESQLADVGIRTHLLEDGMLIAV